MMVACGGGMGGCGLLGFGCGSWDGRLWLFIVVFWDL